MWVLLRWTGWTVEIEGVFRLAFPSAYVFYRSRALHFGAPCTRPVGHVGTQPARSPSYFRGFFCPAILGPQLSKQNVRLNFVASLASLKLADVHLRGFMSHASYLGVTKGLMFACSTINDSCTN